MVCIRGEDPNMGPFISGEQVATRPQVPTK